MSKAFADKALKSGFGFPKLVSMDGRYVIAALDEGLVVDPVVDCEEANDGKTRQEFRDESDINTLMKRYETTGIPPWVDDTGERRFLDVSDVPDFQSAMQIVIDAENAFMALSAQVRKEFENDPGNFLRYVEQAGSDEEKAKRLREWGLLKPVEAPPAPQEVRVVSMPEAAPEPPPVK